MPEQSGIIQFKSGLKSSYTSLPSKDTNTIYFCTDTGEIFVGDTPFSPQVIKGDTSETPELANTVLDVAALNEAMQSNLDACVQEIHTLTDNQLVPKSTSLSDNTYATVKSGSWVAQSMSGTDYSTNRLRGISILDTSLGLDVSDVPEGCFAAILSL